MEATTEPRRKEAGSGSRLRVKKSQRGPSHASNSAAVYLRTSPYHQPPSALSPDSTSSTDDSLDMTLGAAPQSFTTTTGLFLRERNDINAGTLSPSSATLSGRGAGAGAGNLRRGRRAESRGTTSSRMSLSPQPYSTTALKVSSSSPNRGPCQSSRSPPRPEQSYPHTSGESVPRDENSAPIHDAAWRPSPDTRSHPSGDSRSSSPLSELDPDLDLDLEFASEDPAMPRSPPRPNDDQETALSEARSGDISPDLRVPFDETPGEQIAMEHGTSAYMNLRQDEDEAAGGTSGQWAKAARHEADTHNPDHMEVIFDHSVGDMEQPRRLDVSSIEPDSGDSVRVSHGVVAGAVHDTDHRVSPRDPCSSSALSPPHPDAMDCSVAGETAVLEDGRHSTQPTTIDAHDMQGQSMDATNPTLHTSKMPNPTIPRPRFNVKSKSSIPASISPRQYATKCIEAAENSRLSPFALHPEEYHLFRDHISYSQVTTYLNIRNGILRLWLLNPQVYITREKAVGCANWRWFDAASACYDWLVRRGYINYGSVRIRAHTPSTQNLLKQKTVVVIGAGFSGLGCARQLEGLFRQYGDVFEARGELPPKVVVLEGRERVGGRVYSRAFTRKASPSSFAGQRHTAEMGGMIITGFERGNPLNVLVRGQLGLPYHLLNPNMTLYDVNGVPVDETRDHLVEKLYNDCLDRVSEYKFKTRPEKLITGNTSHIEEGKDGALDGQKTIGQAEKDRAAQPDQPSESQQNIADQVKLVPVSTDKVTGQIHTQPGNPASATASEKAVSFGWTLKAGVSQQANVNLGDAAQAPGATLGSVLDSTIAQCRNIVDLGPLDFRLLNWHIANLEYSNATTLNNLSLGGWDIDAGNEWEGAHSMVVGGYQDVARGLMQCPEPLDVRRRAAVTKIKYTAGQGVGPAMVTTDDGTTLQADCVISTIPLGVMKARTVEYNPPLPSWKTDAVDRLGFGILNKVVLVYEKPFWDDTQDIFGVLRMPTKPDSIDQDDYSSQRGRFFQWFNLSKPCGLPCLLALMAGDAGFETERTSDSELVREATQVLRKVFGGPSKVPYPVESIVTRWGSDPFARGSYSSCGPDMQQDDYDTLARSTGNLYFAGEHTIGTHPATVHGAYLSGLRVASEVLEAMIGPIGVPLPMLRPKEAVSLRGPQKRKQPMDAIRTRTEDYETEVLQHIREHIGERPTPPPKVKCSPFDAFKQANMAIAQQECQEPLLGESSNPTDGPSSAEEAQAILNRMWEGASDDERQRHEASSREQMGAYLAALGQYREDADTWDAHAVELRMTYEKSHPPIAGPDELDYHLRFKSRRKTRVTAVKDNGVGQRSN